MGDDGGRGEGRYLLFAGDAYYPGGGWEDFKGRFATAEEGAAEGRRLAARALADMAGLDDRLRKQREGDYWWQVVDPEANAIVARHPAPEKAPA
jgi:hypothetical protein